jgi:hypothetical protein
VDKTETSRGIWQWKQYPLWARGPARISGEEVILDENRAEPYYMYEPVGLFSDLAYLAVRHEHGDFRDILAFVRRYGLLWHGAEDLGTGGCREKLSDWWRESTTLEILLKLHMGLQEYVKNGSAGPLRKTMTDLFEEFKSGQAAPNDETLAEQVSIYLAEQMTGKLEGCTLGITSSMGLDVKPKGPGIFLLAQNPPNLATAACAQLALRVVNSVPLARCPGCGRVFEVTSGKQKYHSPSCANTDRWRRWKKHHAE